MRLVAENLSLERGGRRVLESVSFSLEAGQALVVTGPNGAGKSSLLRALAGLLPLARGRLEPGEGRAEATHYLGHADSLKAALTARENLSFCRDLLGGGGLSPEAALARFGLARVIDFPVRALSAGQKRRVALARLLTATRPLWLLDEPLTALDAAAAARLCETLREHLHAGGLIVAATHAALDMPSQTLALTSLREAA